jgi:hypothetical protein
MNIAVAITLNDGETFSLTPEETAQKIIDALDEASTDKDYCAVTIRQPQHGGVGYVAPPAPAPEPGDPEYIEPAPLPPLPETKPPKPPKEPKT